MKTLTTICLAVLWSMPALAQGLEKRFSATDQHLAFDYDETRPPYVDRMDINGDGKPDVVMIREDENGFVTGFRAVDPRTGNELIRMEENEVADKFGSAKLQLLAVTGDGESTRTMIIGAIEEGAGKTGASPHISPVYALQIPGKTLLGTFPSRHLTGGKGNNSDIEVLSEIAVLDLDGDGVLDLTLYDETLGIVEVWSFPGSQVGVDTERVIEHALSRLMQSYPNPFADQTVIPYEVQTAGEVTLTLFDALGRKVRTFAQGNQSAGAHTITWDGRDAGGAEVANGVYFYQLNVGQDFVSTKQMIRVR